MSKIVSIRENGEQKQFTTSKIKTLLQDGTYAYWVPEGETYTGGRVWEDIFTPDDSEGNNGDVWIVRNQSDEIATVYYKENGTWVEINGIGTLPDARGHYFGDNTSHSSSSSGSGDSGSSSSETSESQSSENQSSETSESDSSSTSESQSGDDDPWGALEVDPYVVYDNGSSSVAFSLTNATDTGVYINFQVAAADSSYTSSIDTDGRVSFYTYNALYVKYSLNGVTAEATMDMSRHSSSSYLISVEYKYLSSTGGCVARFRVWQEGNAGATELGEIFALDVPAVGFQVYEFKAIRVNS
ncbi:MAG: hypothetical protein Q4C03_07730 [bacterium]|nr:hypothetical protein [bacterium]